MTHWIAYYRVSTAKQGRSGLGLEAQRAAVLNVTGQTPHHEFIEVESGKRDDRPQLAEALRIARLTGGTLVVAKLDRLSRNVAFLATLQDSGQRFTCADMPEANELTVHVMAAFAQAERKAISKRTKEALQAARARGRTLGGKRANSHSLTLVDRQRGKEVLGKRADDRARDVMPIVRDAQGQGITSLRGIADHLNARSIKSPRGGTWHAASVARLLSRVADPL